MCDGESFPHLSQVLEIIRNTNIPNPIENLAPTTAIALHAAGREHPESSWPRNELDFSFIITHLSFVPRHRLSFVDSNCFWWKTSGRIRQKHAFVRHPSFMVSSQVSNETAPTDQDCRG
jgi:hypothetical protein